MPAVVNRLLPYVADFSEPSVWNITGATLASASESQFLSGFQTLRLKPNDMNPVRLETTVFLPPEDVSRPMIFTAFARCITGADCSIYLTDINQTSNSVITDTKTTISYARQNSGTLADSGWTVLRSNPITPRDIGSAPTIKIELQFSFMTNQQYNDLVNSTEPYIYITIPALYGQYDFQGNTAAEFAFGSLPQVFRDFDSDSDPDWVMFRLLDILNQSSGTADEFATNWTYVDYIDGYDGTINTRSQLVDPSVTPLSALPWLNQFVGSSRTSGTVTKTPWGSVPGTWAAQKSLMDTPTLDNIISWNEFETYKPSFSNAENVLRWQASTGYTGYKAGSMDAVIDAVKLVLTGDKYVFVYPMKWSMSGGVMKPGWEFDLYTLVSETADVISVGGTSALVRGIIELVKPAGIRIVHKLTTSYL